MSEEVSLFQTGIGEDTLNINLFGICLISVSVALIAPANAGCPPGLTLADVAPPTDISRTFIRKGLGEYGADRKGGTKKHSGADITTRLTTTDPMAYAVFAVAEGVVAYAKFNGLTYDDGWGQVIILDHGNDCYSMYAHLAASPFIPWADDKAQPFMVKLGEKVTKGQHIGFFVDIDKGLDSTGNAQRTAAGARWQTHFELIEAPSGRAGSGTIKGDIFGNDGKSVDPTALLLDLGYKIEDL